MCCASGRKWWVASDEKVAICYNEISILKKAGIKKSHETTNRDYRKEWRCVFHLC